MGWCVRKSELKDGLTTKKPQHKSAHVVRAAQRGDAEKLEQLLKEDANPFACNAAGVSALAIASDRGHLHCVAILESLVNAETRSIALVVAAARNRVDCVEIFLNPYDRTGGDKNAGYIDVNYIHNNETALMAATSRGHLRCATLILNHNAVDINRCNWDGDVALILATRSRQAACVGLLVRRSAAVNIQNSVAEGTSALMIACDETKDVSCAMALLDAPDIDFKLGNPYESLLTFAARDVGNVSMVKKIMELVLEEELYCDGMHSALTQHCVEAAEHNDLALMRSLRRDFDADVSGLSNMGRTPLMIAVEKNYTLMVDMLLRTPTPPEEDKDQEDDKNEKDDKEDDEEDDKKSSGATGAREGHDDIIARRCDDHDGHTRKRKSQRDEPWWATREPPEKRRSTNMDAPLVRHMLDEKSEDADDRVSLYTREAQEKEEDFRSSAALSRRSSRDHHRRLWRSPTRSMDGDDVARHTAHQSCIDLGRVCASSPMARTRQTFLPRDDASAQRSSIDPNIVDTKRELTRHATMMNLSGPTSPRRYAHTFSPRRTCHTSPLINCGSKNLGRHPSMLSLGSTRAPSHSPRHFSGASERSARSAIAGSLNNRALYRHCSSASTMHEEKQRTMRGFAQFPSCCSSLGDVGTWTGGTPRHAVRHTTSCSTKDTPDATSRRTVDVNVQSHRERVSALMLAAELSRAHLIPLLVAHAADINARNRDGHTALHLACARDKVDSVRALVDAAADVNAVGTGGTPLHVCAASANKNTLECIELLLRANARKNSLCTFHGRQLTAYQLACSNRNTIGGANTKTLKRSRVAKVRRALAPMDKLLERLIKGGASEIGETTELRDYLMDPLAEESVLMERRQALIRSLLGPLIDQCGQFSLDETSFRALRTLLEDSRGVRKDSPGFLKAVNVARQNVEQQVHSFHERLRREAPSIAQVENITLDIHQFSECCLGEGVEQVLRADDDRDLILLMKRFNIISTPHEWIEFLSEGSHRVFNGTHATAFTEPEWRNHIPALLLVHRAYELNSPFQEAIGRVFENAPHVLARLYAQPMCNMEHIEQKSIYGQTDCAEDCLDMIRCFVVIKEPKGMLDAITLLRGLTLKNDHMELRGLRNPFRNIRPDEPELMVITANLLFQHQEKRLIAQCQLTFSHIAKVQKYLKVLDLCCEPE